MSTRKALLDKNDVCSSQLNDSTILNDTVKNSDYIAFNDRKSNYRVQKDIELSGCSLLCGIILAFAGRD